MKFLDNSVAKHRQWLLAATLSAALVLYPVFISLLISGPRAMFNFFAMDSMYYMAIAKNFARYGMISFDTETVTNGFHPLWQYMLIVILRYTDISPHNQIYLLFGLSVILVYAAYVLLSVTLMRTLGSRYALIAILALFPGFYSLWLEPTPIVRYDPGLLYLFIPHSGINGMETPLSLLLWALALWLFTSHLQRTCADSNASLCDRHVFPLSLRICLGLIVLSRLDDVFLLSSLAIVILLQTNASIAQRMKTCVFVFWPAAILLAAYIFYNWTTVGALLPTSAMNKMQLRLSSTQLMYTFLPYAKGFREWLTAPMGYTLDTVRVMPLLYALLTGIIGTGYGIAAAIKRMKQQRSNSVYHALLLLLSLYLIQKSAFIMVRIPILMQGYWYCTVMVAISNLLAGMVLARLARRGPGLMLCITIGLLAATLHDFPKTIKRMSENTHDYFRYTEAEYRLWLHGDAITRDLKDQFPGIKLIDSVDGAFAYFLDIPCESITGLPSSPKELESRRTQDVFKSLANRGFNVVPRYYYLSSLPDSLTIVKSYKSPELNIIFNQVEPKKPELAP